MFPFVLFFLFATSAQALTLDQIKKVDQVADLHEVKPDEVRKTVEWLETLEKDNPKDDEIPGHKARLLFLLALNEDDKSARIKKYQLAIDQATKAIALNPESVPGNFWMAAAIGKQGLDIGIGKALKAVGPMRDSLKIVEKKNEKYENAGAHRALGRLYFKLPGWPLSFGSNSKALEHFKKAVEIAPDHVGNRVFYAEVLAKEGFKEEARKELDFFKKIKPDPSRKREFAEYFEIANDLEEDL
jgi:tetratricopeptide (TPR) repeat protein